VTQHTPGPWSVGPYRGGSRAGGPRGTIIVGQGDERRTDVHLALALEPGQPFKFGLAIVAPHPGVTTHTSKANARLIAAAPEMLALLNELIDIEGPQPGTAGWAAKVRAVITKATAP